MAARSSRWRAERMCGGRSPTSMPTRARTLPGKPSSHRCAVRHRDHHPPACAGRTAVPAPETGRPLLEELSHWLDTTLHPVPGRSALAAATRYSRSCWDQPCRHPDDGRLEIDNSAAERALRGVALGRENWLFAGSDAGGKRAAAIYSFIETCKINGSRGLPSPGHRPHRRSSRQQGRRTPALQIPRRYRSSKLNRRGLRRSLTHPARAADHRREGTRRSAAPQYFLEPESYRATYGRDRLWRRSESDSGECQGSRESGKPAHACHRG